MLNWNQNLNEQMEHGDSYAIKAFSETRFRILNDWKKIKATVDIDTKTKRSSLFDIVKFWVVPWSLLERFYEEIV